MLKFDKQFCEMRRYKREAGIDVEEGVTPRDPVPRSPPEKEDASFRTIQLVRQECQERRSLPGSPPPPAEAKPVLIPPTHLASVDSPKRLSEESPASLPAIKSTNTHSKGKPATAVLNESPEDPVDGLSPFAEIMQKINKHTRKRGHDVSVSTDDGLYGLEDAPIVVPTLH